MFIKSSRCLLILAFFSNFFLFFLQISLHLCSRKSPKIRKLNFISLSSRSDIYGNLRKLSLFSILHFWSRKALKPLIFLIELNNFFLCLFNLTANDFKFKLSWKYIRLLFSKRWLVFFFTLILTNIEGVKIYVRFFMSVRKFENSINWLKKRNG